MNQEEWSFKAAKILEENERILLISARDAHVLVCAGLIAMNDKSQRSVTRDIIGDLTAKLAAKISAEIPEMNEIYTNIPVTKT